MKNIKNTRLHKLIGGKGIYITLGACIIAVAGAGVAAYNKAVDRINDDLTFSIPDTAVSRVEQQVDEKTEGVKKEEENDLSSAADKTDKEENDSSAAEDKQEYMSTQPNVMPVNGEVINPFSNGDLVKSDTLHVWKTHDGADIAADTGSQVKAMNRGEVTKIWEDPLWGCCITIDHGSGIEGHYYNLSKAVTVEEGDKVESGQVIGSVGDTAQIEAAEASHLHFGVKRNGSWIDPITYINPNTNK